MKKQLIIYGSRYGSTQHPFLSSNSIYCPSAVVERVHAVCREVKEEMGMTVMRTKFNRTCPDSLAEKFLNAYLDE